MRVKLSGGVIIEANPVSSVTLLQAQSKVKDPTVPRFYIESQDRWVDNPSDPTYIAEIESVARKRAELAVEELIRSGVVVTLPQNDRWIRSQVRYRRNDPLLSRFDLTDKSDLAILYMYYEAIQSESDLDEIVAACCLLERRVQEFMQTIGVVRGGTPIDKAGLRYAVDTGIGSSAIVIGKNVLITPMEEYNAATSSNLSWFKWRNMGYSLNFMEETVACARTKKLTEIHASDAQQADAVRKSKNRSIS